MTSHGVLNPALKAILDVITPQQEDWVVRFKIIEDLKNVVSSVENLRDATVEPFGSFVSNLFSRWGDLDISITLTGISCLSSAGKKIKQNLLDELLRALTEKAGWRRLQCIRNARVPILKFECGHQKISCDVSIDNLEGQIKSNFLFWVNMIDGRFRDMVLLVKEWAKAHKINDSKAGTLNSYSLSLFVIFHFQTCEPAILPPLKDIYPRNVVDDFKGVRIDAERQIKEICSANIARFKSNKSRAFNHSSLSELFISFLAKFSDIKERAKHLGVCTFSGQWESISCNTRWLPKTYALFIEDPFEQPENSARAVSARNLVKISEAFRSTYYRLVYANQNHTSLLDILVRPQVSKVITGKPVRTSTTISGHNLTIHQEASRTMHTSGTSTTLSGHNLTIHQEASRTMNTSGRSLAMHQQANRLQHQHRDSGSENRSFNPAIRRKKNHSRATQRKRSNLNNLTNQRQETVPNNLTMRRQESKPNNMGRQESKPNNVSEQQQESKPNNASKRQQESEPNNMQRRESKPNNVSKRQQESEPNNMRRQESKPNNVSKQQQESEPNNMRRQESKPNNVSKRQHESKQKDLSKQKQASNGNNLNKHVPAQLYRNQTQQIWRPKSEG